MIVISYYFSRSKEVENVGRFWKYSCQQLFKGTRRFVAYNFQIKVLIAYWLWLVASRTRDRRSCRAENYLGECDAQLYNINIGMLHN